MDRSQIKEKFYDRLLIASLEWKIKRSSNFLEKNSEVLTEEYYILEENLKNNDNNNYYHNLYKILIITFPIFHRIIEIDITKLMTKFDNKVICRHKVQEV